jgi:integrase
MKDLGRRRKHLDPVWGPVPLNKIRRGDVERWLIDLEQRKGLSPATVWRCYTLLSSSLRAAVHERRISASPCDGVRPPKIGPGRERFLSRDEASRIARVMTEPYRSLFLCLVGTGARWGELVGLHWSAVNLEAGYVDINDAWDSVARSMKGYTKSRSRRRVWLSEWVVDVFRDHAGRYPPTPCRLTHRAGSVCRGGLVFTGRRDGGLIEYNVFFKRHWGGAVGRTAWRAIDDPVADRTFVSPSAGHHVRGLEDAAMEKTWQDGRAGVGPVRVHDCRHTFASWLVQAGVPLLDVADQLGHSYSSTAARYGHLGTSSRDRVRSAMAWGADDPEPPLRGLETDQDPSRDVLGDQDDDHRDAFG